MPVNTTTSARSVELQDISAGDEGVKALFPGNLELIQGLKVNLSVSVGRSEITVAELFALKEDSLLTLDAGTNDPVEIYLDSRLVGRGELVVVGDNFGVRITEFGKAGAK
jgi:flagellar motor switch protein FliN/FliY